MEYLTMLYKKKSIKVWSAKLTLSQAGSTLPEGAETTGEV